MILHQNIKIYNEMMLVGRDMVWDKLTGYFGSIFAVYS